MCWKFLSIKVLRFDKKKVANKYNNLANKKQVLSNPTLAFIGKRVSQILFAQHISFQILICLFEVFLNFVHEFIFLVQLEINKQYTPI